MIFMRNKRIFAIFMVLTALSACGQKGPLRLESAKSQENSQEPASSKAKQSRDLKEQDGKGDSL